MIISTLSKQQRAVPLLEIPCVMPDMAAVVVDARPLLQHKALGTSDIDTTLYHHIERRFAVITNN